MTSLIEYLFGRQPWFSMISYLADEELDPPLRQRNRLRKEPPPERLNSCDELLDKIHSQSYLSFPSNHSNATVLYPDSPKSQPRTKNPSTFKSTHSHDSLSLYSQHEMKPEELRRTRAKTPVFRIGQLENKTYTDTRCLDRDIDTAVAFAQQYQATLPSRGFTPCSEFTAQISRRNGLRRVKCHDSLRDIAKNYPEKMQSLPSATPHSAPDHYADRASLNHETFHHSLRENSLSYSRSPGSRSPRGSFESHFTRRPSSDSETLLGSDSELSPSSPVLKSLSHADLETIKMIRDSQISIIPDPSMPDNDVSMQLCMDLLTNDLTTALGQQNPTEPRNTASGLKILLMIEAYESLQQKLRQEQWSQVPADSAEHVGIVEDILDHWLQALRSVYERSVSRGCGNPRDSVALCLSS
jgi:hypothetical protein